MAVQFLPNADDAEGTPDNDRGELAEVIDLRSRLPEIVREREPGVTETTQASELAQVFEAVDSTAEETERGDVRGDAVRLLARRALSSGELRRELSKLTHPTIEVDIVIDEFAESLYLDDFGLARTLTENLRERKRASRSQIRAKLRERQISDEAIDQAIGELDQDEEHDLLVATANDRARRLSGLDRSVAERRLLGFLARRGWTGEQATRACRAALGAAGTGSRSGVSFS